MKMAPRRSVKVINNNVNYNNLTINDVMCPICRSILIEPVTLPCNHGFCLSCFDGTMENATLTCPLCRLRIGSFLRSARKNNTLINVSFWAAIKQTFPQQVKNKINGIDENLLEEEPIRITKDGEIRREYEDQRLKHEQELQRQREAEAQASEVLIRKIQEEEEFEKQAKEQKLKLDEQLAKKLADELNKDNPPKVLSVEAKTDTIREGINNELKLNTKTGPLDTFFIAKKKSDPNPTSKCIHPTNNFANKEFTVKELCQNKRVRKIHQNPINFVKVCSKNQTSDNNTDSIGPECRHFKPIRHEAPVSSKPLVQVPALRANATTVIICAPSQCRDLKINPELSAFISLRMSVQSEGKTTTPSEEETPEIPYVKTISDNKRKRKTFQNDCDDLVMKKQPFPSISPPFLGFNKRERVDFKTSPIKKPKLNGNIMVDVINKNDNNNVAETFAGKNSDSIRNCNKLQEDLDFELARKLHDELNNSRSRSYVTRKASYQNSSKVGSRKRQTTLDDLIVTKT